MNIKAVQIFVNTILKFLGNVRTLHDLLLLQSVFDCFSLIWNVRGIAINMNAFQITCTGWSEIKATRNNYLLDLQFNTNRFNNNTYIAVTIQERPVELMSFQTNASSSFKKTIFTPYLLNHWIRLSHFSESWKEAKVITLPKPGKDRKFIQNLRLAYCLRRAKYSSGFF
jgi:hypothetical protein